MMRKFELRDQLLEEPFDNEDGLVTQIENAIFKEKTDLAAELAKNRIKADASSLDELLPKELREVEQHKAELPLYCWVNPLKISVPDMVETLIHTDELRIVEYKKSLDKKCFMLDPHCPNVLMFHYALREKILSSDHVKDFKLIVQVNIYFELSLLIRKPIFLPIIACKIETLLRETPFQISILF